MLLSLLLNFAFHDLILLVILDRIGIQTSITFLVSFPLKRLESLAMFTITESPTKVNFLYNMFRTSNYSPEAVSRNKFEKFERPALQEHSLIISQSMAESKASSFNTVGITNARGALTI